MSSSLSSRQQAARKLQILSDLRDAAASVTNNKPERERLLLEMIDNALKHANDPHITQYVMELKKALIQSHQGEEATNDTDDLRKRLESLL